MTDKPSSPSSSSGNGIGYSPRSRGSGGSNNDDPQLVIRKEPPTYVYSNESFEIEIALERPKGSNQNTLRDDVEVVASLHYSNNKRRCENEGILITQPSHITLRADSESSSRKIRCMIRMDVIRRDQGVSVEIRFSPRSDRNTSQRSIAAVATNPINIVNYKIKVTTEEDWGHVWYKDEGGRDKSMEVFAAIYDKDGQIRTGEQIPLCPTLCYAAESNKYVKVTNQEILRTLGSTKIVVDKDSGKARIRFRVEDVSKNHQGQDFSLQVGTDPKAKGFKDIASAYTPQVNVRSKRNKRSRKDSTGGRGSASERRASPLVGRARTAYDDRADPSFEGADIVRLRDAMKSVINWTDEVVNGLYPLQWQVLGYAQNPDGSPDYSRPYHNMPNPNPCISHILSLYSDSVRESLRVLTSAVERASPLRPDESQPYAPAPATQPPTRDVEDQYGMMRNPPSQIMHTQAMMPPQAIGQRPGMHPSMTAEAFRDRPLQARAHMPHQMHQLMPNPFLQGRSRPGSQAMPMDESEMMTHGQPPHRRMVASHQTGQARHGMLDEENHESEVEYVLAKQYKALRTGERLGFPAYSASKEILGFYRESSNKVGVGQFSPISRHRSDFGPLEIMQATEILDDAIAKKSEAVHRLKEWGSIANLLDHALVYDWSKEIGSEPPSNQPGA